MRWMCGPKVPVGTTRIRRIFCFLPTYTAKETRWLEMATVKEKYIAIGENGTDYAWDIIEFLD